MTSATASQIPKAATTVERSDGGFTVVIRLSWPDDPARDDLIIRSPLTVRAKATYKATQ